jgi:putative flippase GtrA
MKKLFTPESKKALLETGKELLRYLWFGLLALIVAFVEAKLTDGTVSGNLALVVALAIRALDKYVHANKQIDSKGLAPEVLQR